MAPQSEVYQKINLEDGVFHEIPYRISQFKRRDHSPHYSDEGNSLPPAMKYYLGIAIYHTKAQLKYP
ncbi:hypothetical protein LMH87_004744 [Akanthomyces muscarius]|uniref:Uncharacterized protein n=1 Tax=Akanthomyces muscarius TaxID=2231603 RepID=A0A9W8Q3V7_AKAMU|nr:hypothetical protein LMH87_004744 [Akanthomyces muscarius]KAJ4145913.1 hypothetical protein LMH87_004744 [Akanthomyces muscarius]